MISFRWISLEVNEASFHRPIGSMQLVYLPTLMLDFMVNVGLTYIDPMG